MIDTIENSLVDKLLGSPIFLIIISLLVIFTIAGCFIRLKMYNYLNKNYNDKIQQPTKNKAFNAYAINFGENFFSIHFNWELLEGKHQYDEYLKKMTLYIRAMTLLFLLTFIIGAICFFTIIFS